MAVGNVSRVKLDVQHTPAHWDDPMSSVTVSMSLANPAPGNGFSISKDLSVTDARRFIESIEKSIAIVEADNERGIHVG